MNQKETTGDGLLEGTAQASDKLISALYRVEL